MLLQHSVFCLTKALNPPFLSLYFNSFLKFLFAASNQNLGVVDYDGLTELLASISTTSAQEIGSHICENIGRARSMAGRPNVEFHDRFSEQLGNTAAHSCTQHIRAITTRWSTSILQTRNVAAKAGTLAFLFL